MDISSLQGFLSSSKSSVETAVKDTLGDTFVVLGNEAADLDSIVAALVTAYYTAHRLAKEEKENKAADQQSYVFPVINCTRVDLPLRTEATYFLKANGIKIESLICRDEIDLAALHCGGKLKLTLVDHNILSPSDSSLTSSIVRVIDHHKREKPLDRRDNIEPVGSCCTLVTAEVLGLFDKDGIVCNLLYGTILLDTVNLSPAAQRTTPKDMKSISDLEDCLSKITPGGKRPTRDEVYTPIIKAKTDISQLSTEQLLRKDFKILKTPQITIAIPAVPLLSQKFLELPGAIEGLKNCQKMNRCTAVVLMGWDVGDLTNIRRDLTVFSDGIHKAKQVCTPLESCESLPLQLIRSSTDSQSCYWLYDQKNVGLSRKFILPFLSTHFETKAQNQLDVDALGGVDILIPNGEMSVPSISYSSAQNLGVLAHGDPISHGGSNQSSAYNSCPYTPQNSCAEPADGYNQTDYFLPSFNSKEMIEKIEYKRHKLRGYDKIEDQLNPGACSSYPFTPKNSYVDSSMEQGYLDNKQQSILTPQQQHANTGGILHAIDSEVLLRKLKEKRRADSNSNSSNTSSKSQSLTKLNTEDFLPGGDTFGSNTISPSSVHQFQYNPGQTPPTKEEENE